MRKLRFGLIVIWMLMISAMSANAQVSIGIGLPNVSIGINLPLFPELVPVPGYPVYYAPRLSANYFFYDGMYWVFQDDAWYASSWYNGPWYLVEPVAVPVFILRIPVRYYRQPPVYFREWRANAPPRWGERWGRGWEQRRRGWDRWDRRSAPARAPLPVYQRRYSGDRYPTVEQQHTLRSRQYRYQPRDTVVRQHFKQQAEQRTPAPAQRGRQEEPPARGPGRQDTRHSPPAYQGAPAEQRSQPQRQSPPHQRDPEAQHQRQQPDAAPREQQAPRLQDQGPRTPERGQEPVRGRGQGQNRDEERGRGRND